MNLIQSFELVGAILTILVGCVGIVAIPGDDKGIVFAAKLILLATWMWGTIISAFFYLEY